MSGPAFPLVVSRNLLQGVPGEDLLDVASEGKQLQFAVGLTNELQADRQARIGPTTGQGDYR